MKKTDGNYRRRRRVLACALLALTLSSSCGGGVIAIGGGITGSGFTSGVIAGFGSIVVSDISYELGEATITNEGVPIAEADLRLGMVVTIFANFNADGLTATALTVDAANVLQGMVESVDVGGGSFEALSQTILVDADTVFDGVTLATLMVGDSVEISGFIDADGNVRASRVEDEGGSGESELSGIIENFDAMAETFTLGPLTVDFSSADIEGEPPGGLMDGLLVEVETTLPVLGDVFEAEEVEVGSGLEAMEGDEAEFEGVVTEVVSGTEFVLNQVQTVVTDGGTVFEGGVQADIEVNVELSAKGIFGPEGEILADEVEFHD